MIKGIYTAARGLNIGFKNMGVVANNLANLNTTGYKRELPFSEMLDQMNNSQVRQFTDYQQGEMVHTDNPLDIALVGDGFFTVETENGETQFTKNGKFMLSEDGFLITTTGQKVMGENGEINLNEYKTQENQQITITKNGEIKVGNTEVDSLLISKIEDKNNLKKVGGSSFILEHGDYETAEEDEFEVAQGFLENSNVNPVIEMESMIQKTKDYETSQKIIQSIDKSLEESNEMGRV